MTPSQPLLAAPIANGEQRSILFHGLAVFAVTGALALAGAVRTIVRGEYVPSDLVTVPYALMVIFLATALIGLTLRTFKHPRVFETLFALAMLSGAWLLADLFFRPEIALFVGSAVILLRFAWKSVFSANACLAIGVSGVAASLAQSLSPTAVLALLLLLSLYDVVAVYGTKHMVTMFRELASRGAVFAFALTPLRARSLFAANSSARRSGESEMLLGTGDVALPVMLAVAALRVGPVHAVAALAGAMCGFVVMVFFFLAQPRRAPVPALPPIAIGAALAYLASFITP